MTLHQASNTEPFRVWSAAAKVTATEAYSPATMAHGGSHGASAKTSHAKPMATT
jgi:hypothetical protein